MLTTFDDDNVIFGSLSAGDGGFLLKDAKPEDLMRAIHAIRGRTRVIDDQVADRLMARLADPAGPVGVTDDGRDSGDEPPGSPRLTERERDACRLVAAGASNRESPGPSISAGAP